MVTKTKVTKAATPKAESTTKSSSVAAKPSKKKTSAALSHEEIARQAYMLWVERGGSEIDNWLEAERNLR